MVTIKVINGQLFIDIINLFYILILIDYRKNSLKLKLAFENNSPFLI